MWVVEYNDNYLHDFVSGDVVFGSLEDAMRMSQLKAEQLAGYIRVTYAIPAFAKEIS